MSRANVSAKFFLEGLKGALDSATDAELAFAWSSSQRRTAYYRGALMSSISKHMMLRLECEILLVDFSLHDEESGIPLVFIESENDSFSAMQEIGKLATLRAPLRVLFSVVPWLPDPNVWPPNGGLRDVLLPQWRAMAARYDLAYGGPSGHCVAVIGEWRRDATLVFYAHSLSGADAPGLSSRDEIVWSRRLSVAQPSASAARRE